MVHVSTNCILSYLGTFRDYQKIEIRTSGIILVREFMAHVFREVVLVGHVPQPFAVLRISYFRILEPSGTIKKN